MSEREKILGRIREALTVLAPLPGAHDHHALANFAAVQRETISHWLPAVGQSFDEQIERFRANAIELRADFHLFNTVEELTEKLREISFAESWKKIGAHHGDLIYAARSALNLETVFTDGHYDVQALESCDAGLSGCDALIAQTGSVLVSSRSAGGRALSVLPPHHVVLARRDQLVRDLPAALALLKRKYAPSYPSFLSFITGPSRTGDIERILVLGAHGPKKLTILCV